MPRYKLRTLLIVLAIGPMVLAALAKLGYIGYLWQQILTGKLPLPQ